MSTTDPTALTLTGWPGTAIPMGGTVYDVDPIYDTDGTTVLTAGTPHDLSGWVFMLGVKKRYTDSEAEAVYKHDWQIDDGTDGTWSGEVPDTVTLAMPFGSYVWSIHVIESEGLEPRFFSGGPMLLAKTAVLRITPAL